MGFGEGRSVKVPQTRFSFGSRVFRGWGTFFRYAHGTVRADAAAGAKILTRWWKQGMGLAMGIDRLSRGIAWLTYGLVMVMILVGTWNVIGRYLGRMVGMNLSSNALIEGQWYLFDLVFLLGGAYALQKDEHVRVDVFYSRWSPKTRAMVDFLGTLLFLLPFALMVVVVSWPNVLNAWAIGEMSPDPDGLPRYPIKTMILVGFVLMILQGIAQAIKHWHQWRGPITPEVGDDL